MATSPEVDAYRDFRRKLDALSQDLNAVAGQRETAAAEARAAYQEFVRKTEEAAQQAEEERDQRLLDARVAFEQGLSELRDRLSEVRPIAPMAAVSPPTKRAAYSDRTALLMAQLSMLAYERFENGPSFQDILRHKLEIGGLTLEGVFDVEGTQGFVCSTERLAAVVFRGTTDAEDWGANLNARRVVIKNHPKRVRAHAGFLGAYQKVEESILQILKGIDDADCLPEKRRPIYLTGHSLGGALAVVASAALPMEDGITGDQIAAVYTYGAPRVGGGDFREIIKVPHYRVFNPWDLVPAIPPVWASFQHTGDMRFLAYTDRSPMIRKQFWGGVFSFGLFRHLWLTLRGSARTAAPPHDIRKYILRLDAIMRARNDVAEDVAPLLSSMPAEAGNREPQDGAPGRESDGGQPAREILVGEVLDS